MNCNQHYEFWVSYYQELKDHDVLTEDGVQASNRSLTSHCWAPGTRPLPFQEQTLSFRVLYPGLLIGLGNPHSSQKGESQIKLGFTFDPVTGLPFLPGSTVKGILRSAFLSSRDYIQDCLQACQPALSLSDAQIQQLELDLFGKEHPSGSYPNRHKEVGIGRDFFFDAYPVRPDRNNHLLGIENITPHLAKSKELEGLTSPNPLTLLKIMPGVVMQFRFQLHDSALDGGVTVTAAQKQSLFRTILLDFGVGAKTNVGFGSLEPCAFNGPCCYLVQLPEAAQPRANHTQPQSSQSRRPQRPHSSAGSGAQPIMATKESDLKEKAVLRGTVNGSDSYGNYYVTLIPNTRVSGRLDGRRLNKPLSTGDSVVVRIFSIRVDGKRKYYNLDLL